MNINKVQMYNVPLNPITLKLLDRRGIHKPSKAERCANFCIEKDDSITDVYSFYNKQNKVIKRVTRNYNYETRENTTQIRYYGYIGKNKKYRLAEINEYKFGTNNNCTGGTHWHFYYPKFEKKVRFAKTGLTEETNNFIPANNYIIDNNGIKIRPVSIAEYLENKRKLGKKDFIDYPWTTAESITRESAATDSIAECTAVGIIGEKGISLNHLSPAEPSNQDFSVIEKKLKEDLKLQGKNSKVFMIGSSETDGGSDAQFRAIDNFLSEENIPHSKYKTGDEILYNKMPRLTYYNRYNILSALGIYRHNPNHTKLYGCTGQHILYKDGELLLTNPIIDKELIEGNTSAADLVKKSFQYITN